MQALQKKDPAQSPFCGSSPQFGQMIRIMDDGKPCAKNTLTAVDEDFINTKVLKMSTYSNCY